MNHFADPDFWFHYRQLPDDVRALADKNFEFLKADPRHPSLRFKKVGLVYSARVGLHFRALGKEQPDGIHWFWIGDHPAYERLIKSK